MGHVARDRHIIMELIDKLDCQGPTLNIVSGKKPTINYPRVLEDMGPKRNLDMYMKAQA